ncbi:MAG TPA: non-heme iron oxygenase ferredoxin subunit [Ilumatobacter sp.]|nr:non-heme iron oxygenase ferredoxin subunit [Ilumatobacter sp.]
MAHTLDVTAMILLCELVDVPSDGGYQVSIPGYPTLVVFVVGGTSYVTDDRCTHGNASLAEGFVEQCEVECPFHLGRFDVRTGEPTAAPCNVALRTYRSAVVDGCVYLIGEA